MEYVFILVTWELEFLGASIYFSESQLHSLQQHQLKRFPCISYSLGGCYLQGRNECGFKLHKDRKELDVYLQHSVYSDWSHKYLLEVHKLPIVCKYSAKPYTVLSTLSSLRPIASHIFSLISNTTCSSVLSSQYSLFSIFILLTLCFLSYHSANCSLSFLSPSLLQFNFIHELCCIDPVRAFLSKYFLETALPNFPWLSKVRQIPAL